MQLQSTQTWIFWIRSTKRRIYAHHTLMWAQWANKRGQRVQSAAGDLPQPTCLWRQTCRRMSNIYEFMILLSNGTLCGILHIAHVNGTRRSVTQTTQFILMWFVPATATVRIEKFMACDSQRVVSWRNFVEWPYGLVRLYDGFNAWCMLFAPNAWLHFIEGSEMCTASAILFRVHLYAQRRTGWCYSATQNALTFHNNKTYYRHIKCSISATRNYEKNEYWILFLIILLYSANVVA